MLIAVVVMPETAAVTVKVPVKVPVAASIEKGKIMPACAMRPCQPLPMPPTMPRRAAALLLPVILAACGVAEAPSAATGLQTGVQAETTELAIACRHDAALAALDRAEAAAGSTSASGLQRVILLRDAGETIAAARVLRERNARDDVTAEEAVQSGTAVEDGLEVIRAQREARSGRRTCG